MMEMDFSYPEVAGAAGFSDTQTDFICGYGFGKFAAGLDFQNSNSLW